MVGLLENVTPYERYESRGHFNVSEEVMRLSVYLYALSIGSELLESVSDYLSYNGYSTYDVVFSVRANWSRAYPHLDLETYCEVSNNSTTGCYDELVELGLIHDHAGVVRLEEAALALGYRPLAWYP